MGQKKPGGQMSFPESPEPSTCVEGRRKRKYPVRVGASAPYTTARTEHQDEGQGHCRGCTSHCVFLCLLYPDLLSPGGLWRGVTRTPIRIPNSQILGSDSCSLPRSFSPSLPHLYPVQYPFQCNSQKSWLLHSTRKICSREGKDSQVTW